MHRLPSPTSRSAGGPCSAPIAPDSPVSTFPITWNRLGGLRSA